jgi:hypothetical protein
MAGLLRHLLQNIRLVSSFGKSHTKGAYSQKRHLASTTTTLYDWRAADEYVGKIVLVALLLKPYNGCCGNHKARTERAYHWFIYVFSSSPRDQPWRCGDAV